jgi:hypothetical protein
LFLTAVVFAILDASRLWPMRLVKAVWNSSRSWTRLISGVGLY